MYRKAPRTEREGALALCYGRGVVNFAHAGFSAPFFESEAGVRRVGDDVATNRLRGVFRKAHAVRIGHDLCSRTREPLGELWGNK